MVQAVRGAIQIASNTSLSLSRGVQRLVSALLEKNAIDEKGIISIQFTQTKDLTADNPARCLRDTGFRYTALFCGMEPEYEGSLDRIIRVLITYNCPDNEDARPVPVYLDKASVLRKDLQ